MECINPYYDRKKHIAFPCNKCLPCRDNYQREWSARLAIEFRNCFTGYFLTLTYMDEFLPFDVDGQIVRMKDAENTYLTKYALPVRDVQLFLKKLRVNIERSKEPKLIDPGNRELKYFIVGEYGEKFNRPHWHMLIFNIPYNQEKTQDIISSSWAMGLVHSGMIKRGAIEYVTEYMFKNFENSVRLMSQGLGKSYLTKKNLDYHQRTLDNSIRIGPDRLRMPKYLKKKIFNENQLEVINKNSNDYSLDRVLNQPYIIQQEFEKLKRKVKHKKMKK